MLSMSSRYYSPRAERASLPGTRSRNVSELVARRIPSVAPPAGQFTESTYGVMTRSRVSSLHPSAGRRGITRTRRDGRDSAPHVRPHKVAPEHVSPNIAFATPQIAGTGRSRSADVLPVRQVENASAVATRAHVRHHDEHDEHDEPWRSANSS